ncbi:MAG: 3-phosphoshikimate 1-carboxyvinyltransferase [Bilifractor sp.]|jgi:3-phosphoshikimate 1-carboxyvinyltransferase
MKFHPADRPLKGTLQVPGDKSISHRSVMFGSLAEGTTEVTGFLNSADCRSTIACFRKMGTGIDVDASGTRVKIHGKGIHGLSAPEDTLDCGNSGTTIRLISGILAGQPFSSRLTGDRSIQKRPMKRVIDPLTQMGAKIRSEKKNGCVPLLIDPSDLSGIEYHTPVASAQVKSCILLAGLYTGGTTTVVEPALSRNHTELMLAGFGAEIHTSGNTSSIRPEPRLSAIPIEVPGDISSAAYFMAAALMVPGSEVLLTNVGINPTRDGILEVIRNMGGTFEIQNRKTSGGEDSADLLFRSQKLHGCTIRGSLIPRLIDELPVIAVLAAVSEGTTVIRDAAELKVKESDRLAAIVSSLRKMGADVTATDDGMIIRGGKPLTGAVIDSCADHRIAMSFAVASLVAKGSTEILGADCVNISYPEFYRDLGSLLKG